MRTTAALLAAVAFAQPALAQGRLSLSERVTRLEQQAQGQGQNQTTVELLNRLNELQAEVQNLRGMVEQQAFEIDRLKQAAQDQSVDVDTRLRRLEAGGAAPTASVPDVAPAAPPPDLAAVPSGAIPDAVPSGTVPSPVEAAPGVSPPQAPAAGDERAAYDEAFAALRDGRYAESARRFGAFVQQYPNGEYADNATYWLGESYYVTQNYEIALDTFRDLLDRFPQSGKAPDALLKIGYCHFELRQWREAELALNDVVQRYPDTTVARLAQGRLRALRLEGRQ
jgi:tol-pal system protein YbgF